MNVAFAMSAGRPLMIQERRNSGHAGTSHLGHERTHAMQQKSQRDPLPPTRNADVAFYLSCRREMPKSQSLQQAARVPSAGRPSFIHSNIEASKRACAATLGGIHEISPPQILVSGRG